MEKTYKVEGMHCSSCEKIIEMEFEGKAKFVKADSKKGSVEIDTSLSEFEVKSIITKLGYKIR